MREKRGATHHCPSRRRIENANVSLSQQWNTFINLPESKSDLIDFLSHRLIEKSIGTPAAVNLVVVAAGLEDPTVVPSPIFCRQHTKRPTRG